MKIFFLKKTGLSEKLLSRTFLFVASIFPTYLLLQIVPNSGMVIIFYGMSYLVLRCFIQISHFFIIGLRFKFPYETINIQEGQKTYQVQIFPYIHKRQYFFKGKLHRENNAAIVYKNVPEDNEWYVHGEKIEKTDINKKIMKSKIIGFFEGVTVPNGT